MEEIQRLEQAITEAEARKREFVKSHPNGSGDRLMRSKLYAAVEQARRNLRDFKLKNQQFM